MAESKKYLDYAGLSKYDELIKQYIAAGLSAEEARAKVEEAKKVDKLVEGGNGNAYIFNEADGGGAKFVHKDGTESFVGVNDGGESGLAAQIYADKLVNGKWQGAKIDVTNGGVYYTVGDKSFAERAVEANEIATKGDIAAIEIPEYSIATETSEEYAAVYRLTKDGVAVGAPINIAKSMVIEAAGLVDYDGSATTIRIGEIDYEVKGTHAAGKYIVMIMANGDQIWLDVKDLIDDYTAGEGITISTDNVISVDTTKIATKEYVDDSVAEEAETRAAEDAKKVDKKIETTAGNALIFNESDGGGSKFEATDGSASYVGVHNNGTDTTGQLYAVDNTSVGTVIDITQDGAYFFNGNASQNPASVRDVEDNKIATIKDITAGTEPIAEADIENLFA